MSGKQISKKADKSSLKTRIAEMKTIRRRWHLGTLRHFFRVLFTFIFAIVFAVVMISYQFFTGPSVAGRDFLTLTLYESSAMKFYPHLFMGDDMVQDVFDRNTLVQNSASTDVSLITIKSRNSLSENTATLGETEESEIELHTVKGATYRGYMMIVKDPSRVSIGVCRYPFGEDLPGKKVSEIIEDYGAVAGINAGAFLDVNGSGNGGQPVGLVYSNGERLNRAGGGYPIVAGFDKNDILHVGPISNDEAEALGIRDAAAFGPALIVNGIPSVVSGQGSGLNPRSAIGQRADGAVLLLCIDGRQPNSLGASYEDLISIMMEYGAVNACNMDGGSSTAMFLNGEQINDGLAVSGSRNLPTAWIVK